jgi:hypothetical protein
MNDFQCSPPRLHSGWLHVPVFGRGCMRLLRVRRSNCRHSRPRGCQRVRAFIPPFLCPCVAVCACVHVFTLGCPQENILLGLPMDREWYDRVIDCCCLGPDLASFERGDQTEVRARCGIHGSELRAHCARSPHGDTRPSRAVVRWCSFTCVPAPRNSLGLDLCTGSLRCLPSRARV